MIVHSDSILGVFSILLIMLGSAFSLSASVVLLVAAKFRLAAKILTVTTGVLLVFWTLQAITIGLTPQTVVSRGDSYCYDIWCIGVTGVTPTSGSTDRVYKVHVHIFSDAGSGGKIYGKMALFLVDDRDRRFPLTPDPSAIPFTRELAPQEGIDTTLTFRVMNDAKHLYLISEPTHSHMIIVRLFTGEWLAEHLSLRKPALLRVL